MPIESHENRSRPTRMLRAGSGVGVVRRARQKPDHAEATLGEEAGRRRPRLGAAAQPGEHPYDDSRVTTHPCRYRINPARRISRRLVPPSA